MRKKRALVLGLPVVAMVCSLGLLAPREAEAQYYGGGGYRMGGARPGARSASNFRHRMHAYVGGQLGGFFVAKQVTDYAEGYLSHGGGGGLYGGFRLGPFLSLEANWNISFHDDAISAQSPFESLYLMTLTADAKIHIPTYGPVEPFIQGGIGFAYLGAMYEGTYDTYDQNLATGPAFRLGGGLDFWLGPFFSFGGRLLYQGLYFSEDSYGSKSNAAKSNFVNGVSLDATATFHF